MARWAASRRARNFPAWSPPSPIRASTSIRANSPPPSTGATATVDTGSADGVGVIRDPHGSGVFDVTGSHSFTNPGAYPILVRSSMTRALPSTAPSPPAPTEESGPLSPETNLDLAPRFFNQGETSIAVDPNNPNRLFAVATDTRSDLVAAISSDGGATWSTEIIATGGPDGLPAATQR